MPKTLADYTVFRENANVFDPEVLQKILREVPHPTNKAAQGQDSPPPDVILKNLQFVNQKGSPQQLNTQMSRTPNSPMRVPSVSAEHATSEDELPVKQPNKSTMPRDYFSPYVPDIGEQIMNEEFSQLPDNMNETRKNATSFAKKLKNLYGMAEDFVAPEAEAARPPKQEPEAKIETHADLRPFFESAAKKVEGTDPNLLQAVAEVETRNLEGEDMINAVSPKGAKGIGQFTPIGLDEVERLTGVRIDPFNPEEAAWGMAVTLDHLQERFQDLGVALAAYNRGQGYVGNILESLGVPDDQGNFEMIVDFLPAETQEYVPMVLDKLAQAEPRQKRQPEQAPQRNSRDFFIDVQEAADPTVIGRDGRAR